MLVPPLVVGNAYYHSVGQAGRGSMRLGSFIKFLGWLIAAGLLIAANPALRIKQNEWSKSDDRWKPSDKGR